MSKITWYFVNQAQEQILHSNVNDQLPSVAILAVISAVQENRLQKNAGLIDKAIVENLFNVEQLFELGVLCAKNSRFDDALLIFDKLIPFKNQEVLFFYNIGLIFSIQNRHKEAIEVYKKALSINPNHSDTLTNIGSSFADLGLNEEALLNLDLAIKNNSMIAEAWSNRAVVLGRLQRLREAEQSFKTALDLGKNIDYLPGDWVFARMKICEWNNLQPEITNLLKRVMDNLPVLRPFTALSLFNSEEITSQVALNYSKKICKSLQSASNWSIKFTEGEKIRLGYFSADFHNHATTHLMAEFFELHDKKQFKLFAFSFGSQVQDSHRDRIKRSFNEFLEVGHLSDFEISQLSKQKNIHIAIDLKGYTKDSRPNIFSYRAAPVQVNYLGYPGSMMNKSIDYIIADKVLIPETNQKYFSEKIIYLPHCYQVNDSRKFISEKKFSRKEFDLPEDAFVFCCFNNNYKILPETFESWMRMLKKVDGSVLWLLEDNEWARGNLKKEAENFDIDPSRLIFAKRMPLEDHLARHQLADLFLDTSPYNAHTTASDALWAGLPILTLIGNTFAGRVCSSLLMAIDLADLITESREDYENLAIELATDPLRLNSIRERLKQNRTSSPLFNSSLTTKQIEKAFQKILQCSLNGATPENLVIESH
ncbi:tetratricopeptide repeat protein [Polynucleobacter paneuropaeus]|nr:tetratricopeptide repeat protein [Polynucleobacter paneuropaeus]MBT8612041.1 tetratricopeptide repeat protein [Polynucleobacter paneuropaeus]